MGRITTAGILLILVNLGFVAAGVFLIKFTHQLNETGWIDALKETNYQSAAALLAIAVMALGIAAIALAVVGILGALLRSGILLMIYSLAMIAAMIVFGIIGGTAFSFNSKMNNWKDNSFPADSTESVFGPTFNMVYCYAQGAWFCNSANTSALATIFLPTVPATVTSLLPQVTGLNELCKSSSISLVPNSKTVCAACAMASEFSKFEKVLTWADDKCPRTATTAIWCAQYLQSNTAGANETSPYLHCRQPFLTVVTGWSKNLMIMGAAAFAAAALLLALSCFARRSSRDKYDDDDTPAIMGNDNNRYGKDKNANTGGNTYGNDYGNAATANRNTYGNNNATTQPNKYGNDYGNNNAQANKYGNDYGNNNAQANKYGNDYGNNNANKYGTTSAQANKYGDDYGNSSSTAQTDQYANKNTAGYTSKYGNGSAYSKYHNAGAQNAGYGNEYANNAQGSNAYGNQYGRNSQGANAYGNEYGRNSQGANTYGNEYGHNAQGGYGNEYGKVQGGNIYGNEYGNVQSGNTYGNEYTSNTQSGNTYGNEYGNANAYGKNVQDTAYGDDRLSTNSYGNAAQTTAAYTSSTQSSTYAAKPQTKTYGKTYASNTRANAYSNASAPNDSFNEASQANAYASEKQTGYTVENPRKQSNGNTKKQDDYSHVYANGGFDL